MRPAHLLTSLLLLSPAAAAPGAAPSPAAPGATTTTPTSTSSSAATCALPGGTLPTRTRTVFILDTSGSMRGIGDGRADIFGQVRDSIAAYVQAHQPDEADLLTFDAGLRSRAHFEQPARNPAWTAALGALKADGSNTYLYRSLRDALSPLNSPPNTSPAQTTANPAQSAAAQSAAAQSAAAQSPVAQSAPAGSTLTTVFVLTDGIDNDRTRPAVTARAALDAFRTRGPLDRLHYVALGTDIPADARAALQASDYASGLTLPAGTPPTLDAPGLEGGLLTITDPAAAPSPFPDTAPLTLTPDASAPRLRLDDPPVTGGQLRLLDLPGQSGAALLCAPPVTGANHVAPRPRRVLLRVNTQAPLLWLNPGADRTVRAGEDVILRYRTPPGLPLEQATLSGVPGLNARLHAQPGGRELAVQLTGNGLNAGQSVTPVLSIPGLPPQPLAAVTGAPGGRLPPPATPATPDSGPTATGPSAPARPSRFTLLWLTGLILAAALILRWRRRQRAASPGVRTPRPADPTPVEGLEYRDDRTLALVGADGQVSGVPTPLGDPFDLGQMARVPHLSGLRAEQHRDGLRILRIPTDLEVSQGARLLQPGDVVRPGTLLGVAVARRSRAPHPTLGSLAGLGLPLALHSRGPVLHVRGPYGEHAMRVHAPTTDLGVTLRAPALEGLSVSLSGRDLLLLHAPDTLQLRVAGENTVLTPGMPLPPHAVVDFLN
ncbi:VWA domain-containing protein [Deinococcus sp.]|uniref:vWA domain-containing protein n=1 Tax=Deinococcus sp. TaxID=47478 RepID=UPI0025BECF98|nr:VWA domain-containing protein [Deinococcus sp.]